MAIPAAIAGAAMIGSKLLEKKDPTEDIYRSQIDALNHIGLPDLDAYSYVPEEYRYTLAQEDPGYKTRQMALLDRMAELSETGLSDADKASYAQGVGQANQAAGQRSGALMNEMKARGQGGSGLEYALREQAGQEALTRQNQSGLAQAGDSARQRALYQQAYGQALGQQRDQDWRSSAANADVINQFNQLNTTNKNNAVQGNLQRRNDVAQQNYSNAINRVTAANGATNNLANTAAANTASQNAFQNNLIGAGAQGGMGAAGYGPWAKKEKDDE